MIRVALIYGGQSPEHEISIRSARNVSKVLDRNKYDVIEIAISKAGKWFLLPITEDLTVIVEGTKQVSIRPGMLEPFWLDNVSLGKIDFVLPILHGPNGEDGSIQGLLKLLNIPFAGSAILGSAVSMDKDIAKTLLKNNGVRVAESITLRRNQTIPLLSDMKKALGLPFFVKPCNMGSSVGISQVQDETQWKTALKLAFRHDTKVLLEKRVEGREMECAVIGNESPEASGIGEIVTNEFYSYSEKYADNSMTKIIIPAKVSKKELRQLREVALKTYLILNCEGFARVDMFLTKNGNIIVNEVNTIPGFTSISMFPKLWAEENITYSYLLNKIIDFGMEKKESYINGIPAKNRMKFNPTK